MTTADTNASLAGDLGIAAYLNLALYDLLHETRDLKDVATYMPFTSGAGSASMKIRFVQPVDAFSAPGEATAPSIVNWTTRSKTLTVAKANLYRSGSDLAYITGVIQADELVKSFAKSLVYHRSSLIAGLGSGFTTNTAVGTAGVALTVDTAYAGLFALRRALVEGQIDLVTHATGITQFMASLRGESATPLVISPETQGALSNNGSGNIQFSWMGINFRSHASVPKIGSDYSGFMSSPKAIAFTEAPIANFLSRNSFNPQSVAGEGTAIICQDLSTENLGARSYICHYYPGVSELLDEAGVQVLSAS